MASILPPVAEKREKRKRMIMQRHGKESAVVRRR